MPVLAGGKSVAEMTDADWDTACFIMQLFVVVCAGIAAAWLVDSWWPNLWLWGLAW